MSAPIWVPSGERVARANLTRFHEFARTRGAPAGDYRALHRWSIDRPDLFWPAVWEFCEIVAERRGDGRPWDEVVVGLDRMAPPDPALGPRWFTGARLNFAENLLRHGGADDALVFWNEEGRQRSVSFDALRQEVAAFAAALRRHGVRSGDRVAGFLPKDRKSTRLNSSH